MKGISQSNLSLTLMVLFVTTNISFVFSHPPIPSGFLEFGKILAFIVYTPAILIFIYAKYIFYLSIYSFIYAKLIDIYLSIYSFEWNAAALKVAIQVFGEKILLNSFKAFCI